MKGILYANLVRANRSSLEKQGVGELMTKTISDVDDCVEGMRKFTTDVFDTGVVLVGYVVMLFVYDWRLALLSLLFTPISYFCAARMKRQVQRAGAAYKKAAGALSGATLDRAGNAVTYRIYGCEGARAERYEETLTEHEKCAVRSNVWQSALPPPVSGGIRCRCVIHSVVQRKKCARNRMGGLGYCSIHHLYFLFYKADGSFLQGCKAV